MRSYIHCPRYMEIDAIRDEQNAFIQGPEYQEMVAQVSAKLGFHHSNVLRNSEVALLALQCKYEQTWNLNYTHPPPFCAVFSVANAQVVEYSQDIDCGSQNRIWSTAIISLYENVSCFQLQDMLCFIQSNDVNDYRARISDGHISQFLILLHFEAFDGDAPLTPHNLAQQMDRVGDLV